MFCSLAFAVLAVGGAKKRGAIPALLLALLFAGVSRDRMQDPRSHAQDFAANQQRMKGQVELTVRLTSDPEVIGHTVRGAELWQCEGRAEAVRGAGGWRGARGVLRLRMAWKSGAAAPPAYGDLWHVSGVVTLPVRACDPLRRLEVRTGESRRLGTGGGHPWMRWCYHQRRVCRDMLRRGMQNRPEAAAVVEALVIGYRGDVPDEVHDAFIQTGTLHILAISGTHVGVLLVLLLPLLRATGWPRPLWIWVIAPVLTVYTFATGGAASAVRAWIMALAYWTAPAAGRRPDAATALAFSALAIAAVDPRQARDPGFIYSFVAVAGLLACAGPLTAAWRGSLPSGEDDFALPQTTRAALWRRKAGIMAAGMLASSLVAWVVSSPLSAHYGNVISPVSLPGNLPLIPLAFVSLMTGVLSLVSGAVWPLLGEVFNHANGCFGELLTGLVRHLAAVPGGHVYVQTPPWGLVGLAYFTLAGLWLLRGRPRAVLIGALAAVLCAGGARYLLDHRAAVEFPQDGLAPAVFINLPGSADVLVDPGPAYRADSLIRFLRSRGVDGLGALVVTQADAEHAGAVLDIVRRVPVKEVWHPASSARSPVYRATLEGLRKAGIPTVALSASGADARRPLAGGAEWETLYPPSQDGMPARVADAALVWRVGRGSSAFLFAGPCGVPASNQIQNGPVDPGATVCILDRSIRTADAALVEAVGAQMILLRTPSDLPSVRADAAFRALLPPAVRIIEGLPATGARLSF